MCIVNILEVQILTFKLMQETFIVGLNAVFKES